MPAWLRFAPPGIRLSGPETKNLISQPAPSPLHRPARRPGLGRLVWGAALWLVWGAALPAGAEEALFAPRPLAGPPPAEAPETWPAGRPAAAPGLFPPDIKATERGRGAWDGRGGEERLGGEKPFPAPRLTTAIGGNRDAEKPYWQAEARREGTNSPNQDEAKPYWQVKANREESPYFQAEDKAPAPPYWQAREKRAAASPYWQVREEDRERPYWEPPPERVEIIVPASGPSAAAPPSAPEPAGAQRPISYFMYQDESGMKHLTNVPVDPRYREFAVTIRVQRGLAGVRAGPLRFTHENLRPIILRAARIYDLDPALIAAVIKSESAFDAHAVSWAGAQGLMQLMPGTARDMDCADPFDPAQNIMAGSRYLRLMLDTFGGDLTLAVAAYNCGPEQVSRLWQVPDIPETRNYVTIVSRNYERYKGRL